MWQEQIKPDTGVWHGVVAYANERIQTLTAVCVSATSTDTEIRMAQAGIEEMRRLIAVPETIKATTQLMAKAGQRNGY